MAIMLLLYNIVLPKFLLHYMYRGSSNSADSDSAVSLFGSKGDQFYSIISAIPRNSAVFGSHASIDSNSAVSDSAQNFWDKFPYYSRTPCILILHFNFKK